MVIIETPIFTRRIQELIPDEEYRLLQIHLVKRPDAGKTVPILLLYAYPKSEQDDLTAEQLRQIRKIVEREYL
jgi:hypothetical protein